MEKTCDKDFQNKVTNILLAIYTVSEFLEHQSIVCVYIQCDKIDTHNLNVQHKMEYKLDHDSFIFKINGGKLNISDRYLYSSAAPCFYNTRAKMLSSYLGFGYAIET